jgi:hypothetical protein
LPLCFRLNMVILPGGVSRYAENDAKRPRCSQRSTYCGVRSAVPLSGRSGDTGCVLAVIDARMGALVVDPFAGVSTTE